MKFKFRLFFSFILNNIPIILIYWLFGVKFCKIQSLKISFILFAIAITIGNTRLTMLQLPIPHRNKNYNQRRSFRYYSRKILAHHQDIDTHTSRIMIAMELDAKEPLQGALADMFYGCWYDVPFFGERILNQVKEKLSPQTLARFEACINRQDYVSTVSLLATRWSVLVSPSMAAPAYQLRISSDDSRALAQATIDDLLDAVEDDNPQSQSSQIAQIENEFFAHCTATNDTLAFSLVWWELAKHSWDFDDRWIAAQTYLEQNTAIKAKATESAASQPDVEDNQSDKQNPDDTQKTDTQKDTT